MKKRSSNICNQIRKNKLDFKLNFADNRNVVTNADGFYNLKEKNMLHAVYTVAQEKTAARLDLIFEAMKLLNSSKEISL